MVRRRKLSPEKQHFALVKEFRKIGKEHYSLALQRTAAQVVLGASVMRVFKKGTKDDLLPALETVQIADLRNIDTDDAFKVWFEKELKRVAIAVAKRNDQNKRIQPGDKWGHCTKIITLYVRELVLNSRYFTDEEVRRIEPLLYIPIDSIIIKRLKTLGISLPFHNIKTVKTPEMFFDVQKMLGDAAEIGGTPRIWFDDNWADG